MDLFDVVDAVLYLTADAVSPASLPPAAFAAVLADTAKSAQEAGFPPERAAQVADETTAALSEFAEALTAVRRAAEKVQKMADLHVKELEQYEAHAEND